MTKRIASLAAIIAVLFGFIACRHFGLGRTEHALILQRNADSTPIGADTCITCHPDQGDTLAHTVHRNMLGCESCHGPGSDHIADPPAHIAGPKDLAGMSPYGQSEMCLTCHPKFTFDWTHADHKDVTCFQCHSDVVHFKAKGAEKPPKAFQRQDVFCNQCHIADTADFQQLFHHPVPEGQMTCADCHAVHGENKKGIALEEGGRCAKCHAREAGPKVFRHAGLDDGCQTCHAAHGSPVAALLTQQGNSLCLQCHFEAAFPVIQGIDHRDFLARGGACYDCHVEIHGSNSDPSLLGRLR